MRAAAPGQSVPPPARARDAPLSADASDSSPVGLPNSMKNSHMALPSHENPGALTVPSAGRSPGTHPVGVMSAVARAAWNLSSTGTVEAKTEDLRCACWLNT